MNGSSLSSLNKLCCIVHGNRPDKRNQRLQFLGCVGLSSNQPEYLSNSRTKSLKLEKRSLPRFDAVKCANTKNCFVCWRTGFQLIAGVNWSFSREVLAITSGIVGVFALLEKVNGSVLNLVRLSYYWQMIRMIASAVRDSLIIQTFRKYLWVYMGKNSSALDGENLGLHLNSWSSFPHISS